MSSKPSSFDVIIVGNGAIGLACAFALVERQNSLSIGIVGPKSRPYGATVAAGAMLGCHGEITAHALSTELGREKFTWHRRAKTLWPNWLGRLSEQVLAPSLVEGTFVLSNAVSGSLEDENFSAMLRQLSADDVPHELVNSRDVPGLRPTMDARAFRVVHIPDENAINALAYLSSIEQILARIPSVSFIDDLAISLRLQRDGSISGVRVGSGEEMRAKQVLLAAGVGCQALIEQCAPLRDQLPRLFAGVGSSIVAGQPPERISHVLRTPNRAFACGLHVVPRGDELYIGATNTIRDQHELVPRLVDIQFLLDSVIPQISEPIHASPMLSIATGSRPVASDGFPLLGETPVSGLFVATGTFRDGIQLSPLLAQHMADLLLGGQGLLKNPFLPARQPLWTLAIEDAVTLCTEHYLSVFYENGCHPPKVGWEAFLLEVLRKEVREIFEHFGEDHLPPIDFVPLLRERKKLGIASRL
jgi:glycine oxidase